VRGDLVAAAVSLPPWGVFTVYPRYLLRGGDA
jgi:hypothetical protein